jgi:CheY-like chemotaxis protein
VASAASYNQTHMSDHLPTNHDLTNRERDLRTVRLVGFSLRDRELLQLFLRRPPRAGVSLTVVADTEIDADLLIANTAMPEALDALAAWGSARPAIGIVDRFDRDAAYYQIAQDGQMLFSLAQAINRIRAGWTPPLPMPAYAPNEDTRDGEKPPVVEHARIDPPPATLDIASAPVQMLSSAPSVSLVSVDDTATTMVSVAVQPAALLQQSVSAPPAPPPTPAPPVKGLPWQRALDILVIDDSHFSREAISAALIKVGFAVNASESGPEGIKLALEKRYDVALVDFEMPGMQGPEVLRKLRALGDKAPSLLIMLTSRTGTVDRLRAKFAGCDAYLTKPTQMKEFLKVLRDFAVAGKLSRP